MSEVNTNDPDMFKDPEFSSGWDPSLERDDELSQMEVSTHEWFGSNFSYSTPPEVDPRNLITVANQGRMGSCQANSLTTCAELCYAIATGKGRSIEFSRMFAYMETQRIDGLLGRGDVGSTITGGVKVAREIGFIHESMLPYTDQYPRQSPVTDEHRKAAGAFLMQTAVRMRSYDDVFQFLASGQGGVHIGIEWTPGMNQPGPGGFVDSYTGGRISGKHGGHSVCFVGYLAKKDRAGRNYLILANSWSQRFADGGYAYVSSTAVDEMFRRQFTYMFGLSDLTGATPRPIDFSMI